HRAGQRIQLSVVHACRLTEPAGVCRELVPEAIKVDTLATCDQPLHVRTAEAEVPQHRVLENLFPWADSRNRRVDKHETLHTFRMKRSKGKPDHVADVVRDEVYTIYLQCIEHARDVARLRLLVESARGL